MIHPHVGKQDTSWREAIETPRRLACYLSYVGHGHSFNQLDAKWAIGNVGFVIEEVANALIQVLMMDGGDMRFPSNPNEIKRLEGGFRRLWGLPGAVGAVDGSHFPIRKPTEDGEDYINRKRWCSIAGIFVADADCVCLDARIGYPGNVHDSRMWKNTSLYARLHDHSVPLATMSKIEVKSRPFFLLQ